MLKIKNKSRAFTLAEVLITLAVIGVIAAIVVPSIMYNVTTRAQASQTLVAKQKFARAIEQMALHNDIGPYYGDGENKLNATEMFVRKLGDYYSMTKICATNNLDDCWGYKEINFSNGTKYDVTGIVNGKLFKNGGSESVGNDYDGFTQGILATDGTRFIISFNKNCEPVAPMVYTWSSDGTSNSAMGCVSAIIDIDGDKKPNKIGKDISFINATGIGRNCIVEIGNACFGALFSPEPLTSASCKESKGSLGVINCMESDDDYFAGAAFACSGAANLITRGELNSIFKEMYEKEGSLSDDNEANLDSYEDWEDAVYKNYRKGTASDYGLYEPSSNGYILIWTEEEVEFPYAISGRYGNSGAGFFKLKRNNSSAFALCRM